MLQKVAKQVAMEIHAIQVNLIYYLA